VRPFCSLWRCWLSGLVGQCCAPAARARMSATRRSSIRLLAEAWQSRQAFRQSARAAARGAPRETVTEIGASRPPWQ